LAWQGPRFWPASGRLAKRLKNRLLESSDMVKEGIVQLLLYDSVNGKIVMPFLQMGCIFYLQGSFLRMKAGISL